MNLRLKRIRDDAFEIYQLRKEKTQRLFQHAIREHHKKKARTYEKENHES